MTIHRFLISLCLTLKQVYLCDGSPPPVRNFTTITLFTDLKTWNEAARVCDDQGGEILDITYFSLYSIMLTFASMSPWKDLPIGNGLSAWIGLHRRITPLGDMYYSHNCQRLTDFKIAYWNTSSPYAVMDGDATSYCVAHKILVSTTDEGITYTHDYTRESCDEQNQFYCMSENGSCSFEEIDGYYGDASQDFTPDNDIIYPYESEDKCAELCLNSSSVFTHPDIRIVEECWGFSTSGTECRLHHVAKPHYFDISLNRIASPSRKLFIKRCFASAVNNALFDVQSDAAIEPDTTCGTTAMENSTATSLQVFVYLGLWTWNEAFITCKQSGLELLQIQHQDNYSAIQQLVNKYAGIQSMDYIWLGLHEPDPKNHTDVRVWSDCSACGSSNWDPASPPSSNITDTLLCVVLDTSSNYWYTAMCSEQHYFICTGEYGTNHSYTNSIEYDVEAEVSLGPYEVTESSCRDMCSTLIYEDQECWGYAVLEDDTDVLTECYLYFVNRTNSNIDADTSSEPFSLYTKQIWSDTLLHRTGETDSSSIPRSCCDVSGLKSECPVNTFPVYSESVPTTEKLNLLLYTNAVTWNEALSTCEGAGGTLLQPNDASKRFMLQRYIESWMIDGSLSGDLWIGLSHLHADDPCSLRWASDCTRPTWTDFANATYTEFSTVHCIAINSDINFVQKSCDQKLPFICEIYTGPCDILEVISDINCIDGPLGVSLSAPVTTCLSDCIVMTYNNMECWAIVLTALNTCDLIFSADPEYCKENNLAATQHGVIFKTCYTASVSELPPVLSMDDSTFPKTSCSDLIPAELREAACDITTTNAAPQSTTLSIQSLSVTQSSSASPASSDTPTVATITAASPTASDTPTVATVTSTTSSDTPTGATVTSPTSSDIPTVATISSPTSSDTPTVATTSSPALSDNPTVTTITSRSSSDTPTVATVTAVSTFTTSTSPITSRYKISSVQLYTLTTETILNNTRSSSPTSHASPPTTTELVSNFTHLSVKPIYIRPCLCYVQNITNMTLEEWHEQFVLANTVDKRNTSRYKRKLTSVKDRRTSALTISITASSVLIALALYIITIDIHIILKNISYIHGISSKEKTVRKYETDFVKTEAAV